MANPFVAEIRAFGFNFPPNGWAQCDGQLLPISQNTALFSLLGTTYGGDGKSNFALPNLQGSVPMHAGQGPGLTPRFLGERSGSDTVTLLSSEMAAHPHNVQCSVVNTGQVNTAAGNVPARVVTTGPSPVNVYTTPPANAQFNLRVISVMGSGFPHNNDMPTLVMNFCIAMQGVFPPRG
jgi:microcystin-dependent protein